MYIFEFLIITNLIFGPTVGGIPLPKFSREPLDKSDRGFFEFKPGMPAERAVAEHPESVWGWPVHGGSRRTPQLTCKLSGLTPIRLCRESMSDVDDHVLAGRPTDRMTQPRRRLAQPFPPKPLGNSPPVRCRGTLCGGGFEMTIHPQLGERKLYL